KPPTPCAVACVVVSCVNRHLGFGRLVPRRSDFHSRLALRSKQDRGVLFCWPAGAPVLTPPQRDRRHASDRRLSRTPRLVQATLPRARAARTSVRPARRFRAPIRSVRARRAVFARRESREPVGVSARPRAVHVPHTPLASPSRANRRPRSERIASVFVRAVE